MPLHGKIVVIKRSGGDGTEFPLTASCLFGRKPDCDIRIQLPQVSKEHCKIDFNENKEVILTNLSSVNPTRVNGEVLQQSERLKHGDLITIIDRSFRFEYPPAPTPKKRRSSTSGKSETLQVLQDKQTRDTSTVLSGEKRILELTTDSCLKDETNSEKFQRPLEQTVEVEPKEAESLEQNKTSSPFCELYQMIKQNLDSKTQWKLLGSQPQTPVSTSLCTPKAVSVKKLAGDADSKAKNTPQKAAAITTSDQTGADGSAEEASESVAAKPVGKQRKSLEVASEKMTSLEDDTKVQPTTPELATLVQETPKKKWRTSKTQTPLAGVHGSTPVAETKVTHATPQRFPVPEVIEQITGCLSAEKPETPTRRRRRSSTEVTPIQPASTQGQDGGSVAPEQVEDHAEAQPQPSCFLRTSPRTVARKLQAQDDLRELEAATPTSAKQMKRKSEDLETKLPTPKMKRKRVSFGGNLSPELFDKRLPSDSPLRKGAAPRRSLGVPKRKESLLRRASVIGLLTEFEETGPKGNKSPKQSKTPSPKRTPVKAKTPSPKRTPAKAKTPSPKMTPVVKTKEKSPVSKAKTPSPARGRSPSPAKSQPIATPISKKSPSPRRQSKITAVAADTAPSLDSTPTVKGRFSVSRVNTPSPTADQEADAVPQTAGTATPHMTPRRKSIKSTAKKTPKRAMQSAVNVLRRRSGVSRASMKMNSWADIVKFGQTKSKVVVPAKKTSTRGKGKKAVVPKPKTPVRKPNMLSMAEYTSTGHAESPVTIVVGKAHKRLIQAVCAAPKVVPNIAVLKKNRNMDEDLSGVAEIFSTPVSDRQTQSVSRTPSAINTPMRSQSTGMNEMWGLDTPEETGEMVVSPLSVESTAKRGRYSSEAVTRFLQEDLEASLIGHMSPEEESLSSGVLVVDMCSDDSGKPQRPDMTTEASTPKMKPKEPDCLTGVKRMMKTPKQKAAPVEDLRGKLLKTPRQQKPEHGECLTGVKRIMKTPKQKAAPVEDLRGKLLKTPRGHRVSGEAGLDGVKELLQTPKCEDKLAQQQQAEEPKGTCEEQQAEEVSCVEASLDAEANRMTEEAHVPCVESLEGESKVESEASPDVSSEPAASDEQAVVTCVEPAEDVSRLEPAEDVSSVEPAEDVSSVEPAEDVSSVEPAEDVSSVEPAEDVSSVEPAEVVSSVEPAEVVTRVEPAEVVTRVEPAEDVSRLEPAKDVSRLEPAEDVTSVEPAEDVSRLEPAEDVSRLEPAEAVTSVEPAEDVSRVEPAEDVSRVEPAEDVSRVEPAEDVPADAESADAESNGATEDQEAQPEGVLCVEEESPPAAVPDTTEDSDVSSVEHQPEENTKVEESTCDITEVEMTSVVPVSLKKPTRGRKAQTSHDSEVAVEISEHPAPVLSARGRRGKKPGAVVVVEAPAEPPLEDAIQQPAALKPRRGRKPVQENLPEPAKEESPPQDNVGSDESTAGVVVEKPKRGRNTKKACVEQPEVVVDSTAQALGKSIPAAEKEPRIPVKARRGRIAHQDSEDKVKVVAVDIPAVETVGAKEPVGKPRRGRKAKQDSEEQPESEEKNATPGPEKAQSPAPVSKPRRGKKVGKQQEQQSVEQVESAEEKPVEPVQLEAPAETVEVVEAVEAPAEKPKRGGRKSKPVPESVPAPETAAPRRGRRGTKQEKELTLTTEAAEGGNKSKEEEAVGDVPACDDDHAGHVSAPAEEAVVKTVRGRKVKSVVKEEEVPQATPAKRGRRGASVPETAAAPEAVALTPARSGARGRAAKPVKAKEVATEPVEVPPEPVKRGKRAARSTNALTEVSTLAPATESISEEPEAEVAPVEVKKGRGKAPRKVQAVAKVTKEQASEAGDITETKKSTKSVNWKDNMEVEHQTNASPVVKAVRGKRAKIVVVEDDVSQEATAAAAKKSRRTKVESTVPEVTASKPVNKRKATASKAKEDQHIETDVPVKRGRKGAMASEAVASSEDLAESILEGREPTPARGKGRVPRKGKAVSKALETDQAVETEDQPKVRRGRTAAAKK